MKKMQTRPAEGLLQFTRDGRTLIVGEVDALTIIDLYRDARRRIEIGAPIRSIAAFADQLWIATEDLALFRMTIDGRIVGEHELPHDPDARLIASTIGPAAALWTARTPSLVVDDLGTLAFLDVDVDAITPVSGRRYVRATGSRMTLPSGATCTIASGERISSAHVLFDGTLVVAITEHAQAVLVSLSSGRTQQVLDLRDEPIAIAARRGIAVVRQLPKQLALVDLRFGRSLGTIVVDDGIAGVAIAPDGDLLAIHHVDGTLELAPIGNGRVTAPTVSEVIPLDERTPSSAIEVVELDTPQQDQVVESQPTPSRAPWPRVIVDCLDPLPPRIRVMRIDALDELDREIRSVMLWTLGAIATAWDSRRLGYGNEGKHPYEHEVAALVGMNEGFAADYVEAARGALARHERDLVVHPRHRSPETPSAELAAELGLSPAAVDILLVIAAPELHGDVARMYGILANDPARTGVDQRLVEQILDGRVSRHDIAAELHPRAPLIRNGVVEIRSPRPGPFARLEVDDVILARLRGEAAELGTALTIREADRSVTELDLAPGVAAKAIELVSRALKPARIAVRGAAGTGRCTLLAAFAREAGRDLAIVDATQLPRDVDRFARGLGLALRRAQLAGLVPVIRDLDAMLFEGRDATEVARDVIATHPGPIGAVLPPTANAPFPAGHVTIELPTLSETERASVWQRALTGTPFWLRDAAGVAARYRVGPGVIHRSIASLRDHDPALPVDDCIDNFLRQTRDVRLAAHARRVDRLASWSDLVLPSDIMDSLRELVGRVRHRKTVFETWGMGRTMATSRGLTALFQGQPGTGKTLVAGAIARELGLDLYQVDLSKVMSKWIGETERNLATIFDAAEDGQVILLFDEADSLFAKRTEVRSSNDRYANLEVNYLLQRLDAFEGIAILTTNSGKSIDPAFKRRLSFRLSFPFPDEETRAELWRAHLPRELPRGGKLVFDVLARKYQLSGGYIRNACLRAAFLAAQEESALHQHHLERAVALEFAELGKLTTAGAIE